MNIEKPTKQIDARKRLVFSFKELPEVKEALRKRDEVRAAVHEVMAQEPLDVQVKNLRELIVKMLQRLNKDESSRGEDKDPPDAPRDVKPQN